MAEQQAKLKSQLLRNPVLTIVKEASWELPLWSFEVGYMPVRRFRLDILMRMMLHVIETLPVRRAIAIADILHVEELFIEDLLTKMQQNGLVELEKSGYSLTIQGTRQLQAGVCEELQEERFDQLLYSPVHSGFIPTEFEIEVMEQPTNAFRFTQLDQRIDLNEDQLVEGIRGKMAEETEHVGDFVETVDALSSSDDGEVQWVTCYEFLVYDSKEQQHYVRVWNPAIGSWDATLEQAIEEQEAPTWK
ncbi:hypothetical protein CF394_08020 [Tetzosporium hominis]|uniref:Uncharacterized protein n=1 Tax=Tetzosporium hominis TaxID=2020506 RepID=A0A264W3L8_9BACL|nr:hypothetical protein [Tetzosporium hominis]OZS78169.1 hypothetical protein CF394_08020 [Tetzosporium hominis]